MALLVGDGEDGVGLHLDDAAAGDGQEAEEEHGGGSQAGHGGANCFRCTESGTVGSTEADREYL